MAALVLTLQNCTPAQFGESLLSMSPTKASGNGGVYEGKPDIYYHYETSAPCSDRGANGKPLPNKQIFIVRSGQTSIPQLVRENCSDLAVPVNLASDSLVFFNDGSGNFSYQGESYKAYTPASDFEVVAAGCPSGYVQRIGGAHQNLLQYSQDFFSSPWQFNGIQGMLMGSLGSLPRFQLLRNDSSTLEWWRRVHQPVTLEAGKTYAFTFYAQKGTVSEAYFSGAQTNNLAINVYFDLTTGAGRDVSSGGFNNLSFASRPFSGGFILTTYFTASQTFVNYVGVTAAAPAGPNGINDGPMGQVGDSIFATAVQLEDVNNFCVAL
jgi:hypothetical protein